MNKKINLRLHWKQFLEISVNLEGNDTCCDDSPCGPDSQTHVRTLVVRRITVIFLFPSLYDCRSRKLVNVTRFCSEMVIYPMSGELVLISPDEYEPLDHDLFVVPIIHFLDVLKNRVHHLLHSPFLELREGWTGGDVCVPVELKCRVRLV